MATATPEGTPGDPGRRMPSDASTYASAPLRALWHVLTDPLSHSQPYRAHWQGTTIAVEDTASSARYSRMSRHSYKFPPFSKPTRTSGTLHFQVPPPPPPPPPPNPPPTRPNPPLPITPKKVTSRAQNTH